MIYLDTSFVAPYYLNEASSEAVARTLTAVPGGQLAVSDWTLAEFASLLARRVRLGELDQETAEATMRLFAEDAREAMYILEPVRADFTLARELLLRSSAFGLRTPDALHLAVASNHHLSLYSLDRKLLGAAQAFGLSATDAGTLGGA